MSFKRFTSIPKKILEQGRVLARDPKKFIDNINYTLHPEKLREKLLGFQSMAPVRVSIKANDSKPAHLNILLPELHQTQLTGGPNTALNIAYRLAEMGVPVRILAVDAPLPPDQDKLWPHLMSVAGTKNRLTNIEFGSTFDPDDPVSIGPNDVFFATYWTTAYRLKPVLPQMNVRKFIYLIQDFEPGFYAWSNSYAQALETYGMRFHAIINERFIANYLSELKTGQFAGPEFLNECAIFEPAVDRQHFHPVAASNSRRRLLFYARPSQPRNMFGTGFEALRIAASHDIFSRGNWDFVAIGGGGSFGKMDLGGGTFLNPAPWMDYQAYARLMRESDILLCLMLSPHTSYPVLEMAACRGLVVTNSFMNKTQAALTDLSPRIIAEQPNIESIAAGLVKAAKYIDNNPASDWADIALPGDWSSALQAALIKIHGVFQDLVLKAAV